MKSSSKHLTQTKKDQNIDIRSKRLPSESLGRHKEDRDRIAQWEKKLRYRESDDSEFCVHFYIQNVFLSPNRKIDEFLSSVRDRINKAGVCEFVQIVNYYDKEVKLSVGMKYDQDALDILNHKRMILLYNREQKLYETKPIISSVFETYCLAKKAAGGGDSSTRTKNEKTFEKKQNSSSSHSKSNSRRKRKSSVESRKKESGNQNLVRRSNYEKNLIKLDKRYRSKSNSRSSMRNR